MSFNVAMLKQMRAEGLDFDACIRILEAGEQKIDATATERQRRCRARKKANGHGVTVTRDMVSPNENNLTPSDPPIVISDEITPPSEKPEIKPEHIVEAWNTMADEAGLPKAKLTPERRKKLGPFIRRHSVDDITEAIWAIPRSSFLRGENDRGWKANFDFLLQPSSFTKITEGTYEH